MEKEEKVYGAMAGWERCLTCADPVPPRRMSFTETCPACRSRRWHCVMCNDTRGFKNIYWSLTEARTIVPVCWACYSRTGIRAHQHPPSARSDSYYWDNIENVYHESTDTTGVSHRFMTHAFTPF